MLKILNDRVIIDGHEPTREQCETMTLLANALNDSTNFERVEYKSGYAEFEKVGKTSELKFVGGIASFSVNDSTTGDTVIHVNSDGDINLSFSGKTLTLQCAGTTQFNYTVDSQNSDYVESVTTSINVTTVTMKQNISALSPTVGNMNIVTITFVNGGGGSVSKSVDLTTLSGYESLPAGTYQLGVKAKASGYTDSNLSSTVSFTKLAAPVVTADGTTVSWDAITNAESYDVYVDGELYENTTGGGTVTIISFKLWGNGTYQAEEGMTWEQWVNSSYNTIDASIYDNRIYFSNYRIEGKTASDVIIADKEYILYDTDAGGIA